MSKPTIKPVAPESNTPMLDEVAILVGSELEHTLTGLRFRVECIARWLMTEGAEEPACVLVLRQKLGLDDAFYAVDFAELGSGDWLNRGL